ncbi:MAG: MCE family protein [Treponema sp.]|nr:MCE family protein [Candidatus Treponema equifaecale]
MKFKIRFADQIVGIFSLAALAGLVFTVFAIGASQNWFVKKNYYYTVFDSGAGLSSGMDLTYKGFSIGKIKSVSLDGSHVRVDYYILGEYASYVRENSLVQLITSPIGLGSSFVLHPGKSDNLLPGDSEIYRVDSWKGMKIIDERLNRVEEQSDSIGVLMNKVSSLLDNVNTLLGAINGTAHLRKEAPIKKLLENINSLVKNLSEVAGVLATEGAVPHLLGDDLSGNINGILSDLVPVMNELNGIASSANGLVGTLSPEINSALVQINTLLVEVQDVLIGVKNNPLIRGGVPDRSAGTSSTVKLRETEF